MYKPIQYKLIVFLECTQYPVPMNKQYLRIFGNNFARVTEWNNTLFGRCRNYSLFYIRFNAQYPDNCKL